jgi:AraC-like DNA-binding protein
MAVPLRPVAVRSAPGRAPLVSAYREYGPDPAPARAAACTWQGAARWPRRMRMLPDGCLDLVWDGGRARVVRPAARQVRRPVGGDALVSGIRIRPGWAAVVLGAPLRDLPDLADLADLWGAAAAGRLEAALAAAAAVSPAAVRGELSAMIAARLAGPADPDPRVLAAVRLLGGPRATAGDVARRVGLSPRQLRRRFDDHVGLPPKTLQTILRFQRLRAWLSAAGPAPVPLARAAAECGYFDHAHLCRDCARLAGVTPAILAAALSHEPPRLSVARFR